MSIDITDLTRNTLAYLDNSHNYQPNKSAQSEISKYVYKAIKKEPKLSLFLIILYNNITLSSPLHRKTMRSVSKL